MLVYQEFKEMPPKMYMMQVMDKLTKSYCFLWDKKNPNNIVVMSWNEISKLFSKNTFRTCLRKLNDVGLLSYEESIEGVAIELVGWDAVEQ